MQPIDNHPDNHILDNIPRKQTKFFGILAIKKMIDLKPSCATLFNIGYTSVSYIHCLATININHILNNRTLKFYFLSISNGKTRT